MTHASQQAIMHVLQQDSGTLESLLIKFKQLKHIEQILASYLDAKLASRCQVVNLEKNHLTVITNSAIWATQFRFQIPTLLQQLQQHPELCDLKKMTCKIRLKPNTPA